MGGGRDLERTYKYPIVYMHIDMWTHGKMNTVDGGWTDDG